MYLTSSAKKRVQPAKLSDLAEERLRKEIPERLPILKALKEIQKSLESLEHPQHMNTIMAEPSNNAASQETQKVTNKVTKEPEPMGTVSVKLPIKTLKVTGNLASYEKREPQQMETLEKPQQIGTIPANLPVHGVPKEKIETFYEYPEFGTEPYKLQKKNHQNKAKNATGMKTYLTEEPQKMVLTENSQKSNTSSGKLVIESVTKEVLNVTSIDTQFSEEPQQVEAVKQSVELGILPTKLSKRNVEEVTDEIPIVMSKSKEEPNLTSVDTQLSEKPHKVQAMEEAVEMGILPTKLPQGNEEEVTDYIPIVMKKPCQVKFISPN